MESPPYRGQWSREEWASLSIQDRIRAMNDTLDDVEEHDTPIRLDFTNSSESSILPPASTPRSSVIAIWEQQREASPRVSVSAASPRPQRTPTASRQKSVFPESPKVEIGNSTSSDESPTPAGPQAVRDMWAKRAAAAPPPNPMLHPNGVLSSSSSNNTSNNDNNSNSNHTSSIHTKSDHTKSNHTSSSVHTKSDHTKSNHSGNSHFTTNSNSNSNANTTSSSSHHRRNEPADLTILPSPTATPAPTKAKLSWANRGLQNVNVDHPASPLVERTTTPQKGTTTTTTPSSRSSVVDIWKNRASPSQQQQPEDDDDDTGIEPTATNTTPSSTQENATPKKATRTSVVDIWKQRASPKAESDVPPPEPSWKQRAVSPKIPSEPEPWKQRASPKVPSELEAWKRQRASPKMASPPPSPRPPMVTAPPPPPITPTIDTTEWKTHARKPSIGGIAASPIGSPPLRDETTSSTAASSSVAAGGSTPTKRRIASNTWAQKIADAAYETETTASSSGVPPSPLAKPVRGSIAARWTERVAAAAAANGSPRLTESRAASPPPYLSLDSVTHENDDGSANNDDNNNDDDDKKPVEPQPTTSTPRSRVSNRWQQRLESQNGNHHHDVPLSPKSPVWVNRSATASPRTPTRQSTGSASRAAPTIATSPGNAQPKTTTSGAKRKTGLKLPASPTVAPRVISPKESNYSKSTKAPKARTSGHNLRQASPGIFPFPSEKATLVVGEPSPLPVTTTDRPESPPFQLQPRSRAVPNLALPKMETAASNTSSSSNKKKVTTTKHLVTNMGAKVALDRIAQPSVSDGKSMGSKSAGSKSTKTSSAPIQLMASTDSSASGAANRWLRNSHNRPLGPIVGAVVPTPQRMESESKASATKATSTTSKNMRLPKPLKIPQKKDPREVETPAEPAEPSPAASLTSKSSAFNAWGLPDEAPPEKLDLSPVPKRPQTTTFRHRRTLHSLSPARSVKREDDKTPARSNLSMHLNLSPGRKATAARAADKKKLSPARQKDFVRMGQRHLNRQTKPAANADGFPRLATVDLRQPTLNVEEPNQKPESSKSKTESPLLFPEEVFPDDFVPSRSKKSKKKKKPTTPSPQQTSLSVDTKKEKSATEEKTKTPKSKPVRSPTAKLVAKKKELQAQRKKYRLSSKETSPRQTSERDYHDRDDHSNNLSEYTPFEVGDQSRTWSASPVDEAMFGTEPPRRKSAPTPNDADFSQVEKHSRAGSAVSQSSLANRAEQKLKLRREQQNQVAEPSPTTQKQAREISRALMEDSPRRKQPMRVETVRDEKKEESEHSYAHSFIAQEVVRNTPRSQARQNLSTLPQEVLASDERYLDSFMRKQATPENKSRSTKYNTSSRFIDSGMNSRMTEDPTMQTLPSNDATEDPSSPSIINRSYSTESMGSSEYQSLESRTTRSERGRNTRLRRARIERLRKSHGTFISDEFVAENSQNVEAMQSACGALSAVDVASDIVGELRLTLSTIGCTVFQKSNLLKKARKTSKPAKSMNKSTKSNRASRQKGGPGAPFDEDVAIEVEYMEDSADEDDDPGNDFGMCVPIDQAAMAMQWSGEEETKNVVDCTKPCVGSPVSPAGQPSYEEPSQTSRRGNSVYA